MNGPKHSYQLDGTEAEIIQLFREGKKLVESPKDGQDYLLAAEKFKQARQVLGDWADYIVDNGRAKKPISKARLYG